VQPVTGEYGAQAQPWKDPSMLLASKTVVLSFALLVLSLSEGLLRDWGLFDVSGVPLLGTILRGAPFITLAMLASRYGGHSPSSAWSAIALLCHASSEVLAAYQEELSQALTAAMTMRCASMASASLAMAISHGFSFNWLFLAISGGLGGFVLSKLPHKSEDSGPILCAFVVAIFLACCLSSKPVLSKLWGILYSIGMFFGIAQGDNLVFTVSVRWAAQLLGVLSCIIFATHKVPSSQ